MVKRIVFVFLLGLFLINGIFALDTQVKVKTIPFADIQLSVLEDSEGGGSLVQSFTKTSDEYGDVKFIFSYDEDYYSVVVFAKQNYEKIMEPKKLTHQETGEFLLIEMIPEGFEVIETPNSTEVEVEANVSITNETEENVTLLPENEKSVTGFAVMKNGAFSIFGYVVLGVLLIGFIILTIVKFSRKKDKEIKVKKLSEIQQEKEKSLQDRMDDAEKRIEEAKKELEEIKKQKEEKKLKNQDEIEEAKKRLIEDEKRLMELRKKKD